MPRRPGDPQLQLVCGTFVRCEIAELGYRVFCRGGAWRAATFHQFARLQLNTAPLAGLGLFQPRRCELIPAVEAETCSAARLHG